MKKAFTFYHILVILLLLPALATAQQVTGSLKLGGAITHYTDSPVTDFEPRVGWLGGATLGYDFGNGWAVDLGLLYAIKGAYADGTRIDYITIEGQEDPIPLEVPIRAHWSVTYLEAPLLLHYRFLDGSIQPKILIGPQVALKSDATIHFRRKGSDILQSEKDDTIESFDYGLVAGVGVEIPFGLQRWTIEGRYQHGMANIRKATPALYNRGFMILLGVTF